MQPSDSDRPNPYASPSAEPREPPFLRKSQPLLFSKQFLFGDLRSIVWASLTAGVLLVLAAVAEVISW